MRRKYVGWMGAPVAALVASSSVLAAGGGVDCASAEQLHSDTIYQADTSAPGYGNPVGGLGPLPSPGKDTIYFVDLREDAPWTGIAVTQASYNYGIFLTTDCAGTTSPPLSAATGPGPSLLTIGLRPSGRYYVIISSNPADASAPDGAISFRTPTDPVELQSFWID